MLKGCKPETQKLYDAICTNEQKITTEMNRIASDIGVEMVGLQNRIKSASSVAEKIRRMENKGISEEEAILGMYDIIRYTQQSSHDKVCENTNKTIEILKEKGYDIVEIDNKYLLPTYIL